MHFAIAFNAKAAFKYKLQIMQRCLGKTTWDNPYTNDLERGDAMK